MSGSGAPDYSNDQLAGVDLTGADLGRAGLTGIRVAIVAAQWHTEVMDGLIAGAQRMLDKVGIADVRIIRVPGSFELPLGAQAAARSCDAIVALGVVIRGGTPHFDYVCEAATSGLSRVSLDGGVPIGFGLLTCDTDEQALDRAGLEGSSEDKGAEAAEAAIRMALLVRALREE